MSATPPHGHGPHEADEIEIPRPLLVGAGVLVLSMLVMTAAISLTRDERGQGRVTEAEIISARDLAFRDHAEGGFVAWDVEEDRAVGRVMPGDGGFIRGVLRSLVRERRAMGIGPDEPFRLTAFADGRIQIQDRATGRIIDLGAFGPTNAGAFASLLSAKGDRS